MKNDNINLSIYREKFYKIVKSEKLDSYLIGNSRDVSNAPYVVGCVLINEEWYVYENDERGETNIVSKYHSEEAGLIKLLDILRKKKRKEYLTKKIKI